MLQIRLAEMQTAVKHMGGLPLQSIVTPCMNYGAGRIGRDTDASKAVRGSTSATNTHP